MRMISTTLLLIMSFNIFAQTASTEQETCEAAGKIWIEGQGCKVSQDLVDLRTNAAECEDLEGDELTACNQSVAKATADSLNQPHDNSIKKDEGLIYTAALLANLGIGIAFFKRPRKGCVQPSYWLLFAGSIAGLTGEVWARIRYNKLIKDAKEEYEYTDTDKDPTEGDYPLNKQLDAFNRLIQIENAREKAERTREILYTVSTASFAAAAVAASVEAFTNPTGDKTCGENKSKEKNSTDAAANKNKTPNRPDSNIDYRQPGDNKGGRDWGKNFPESGSTTRANESPIVVDIREISYLDISFEKYSYLGEVSLREFAEISIRKVLDAIVPSSHASGLSDQAELLTQGLGQKLVNSASDVGDKIDGLLKYAVARIGVSAILGAGAFLLRDQAKKIKQTSIDRQKELAKMRDQFALTAGISTTRCTDAMRSDSSNPSCFCYLEDGTKDTSKSNLVICVENWGNSNVTAAGNYNSSTNTTTNSGIQTCVTKSYESDLGCKCKVNNSCLTVSSNSINFGSGMSWAGQILGSTNSVFSNGLESAAANLSTYENQAATLNKKFDELSKDSKYKDAITKAKGLEAKILESTKSQARSFLNSNPSAKSLLSVGVDSTSISDETKKIEDKLVASLPKNFSSALKAKKLESFDLDFGEGSGAGVEVVGEDANSNANADYKYDAVLHQNPDASIFKILSNRYMKTGVKNLFEDKVEESK